MPEYRVIANNDPERVFDCLSAHLAELDCSKTLCGAVTFSADPFAHDWAILNEDVCDSPESYADDHGTRCLTCWQAWETANRAAREARGEYVPPTRTYGAPERRKVSAQVKTARIAQARSRDQEHDKAGAYIPPTDTELFTMLKSELKALGTDAARAELERRKANRAARKLATA